MANPMRLSSELIKDAEKQTKRSLRSVPKQIEYWASIGKKVESSMTPADIAALANGEVEIKILRKKSEPVSFEDVFTGIEADRAASTLAAKVLTGDIWYEESKEHAGLLVRVSASGKRDVGTFKNGKFQIAKKLKKIPPK